jgi:hypothetical protein
VVEPQFAQLISRKNCHEGVDILGCLLLVEVEHSGVPDVGSSGLRYFLLNRHSQDFRTLVKMSIGGKEHNRMITYVVDSLVQIKDMDAVLDS